jgi:predicted secreted protein
MASPEAIYAKTPAGSAEVRSRKLKLAPKLRTMLILVDGHKPVGALRDEASACGMPSDCIEQLESLGLVESLGAAAPVAAPAPGAFPDAFERFRAAQKFMNDTVVNALGIKAFFFTMKLERTATVDDLKEVLPAYQATIAKASGAAEADVLTRRVREMLGAP